MIINNWSKELTEDLMIRGNLESPETPERNYRFKELLECFSEEAKDVIQLVFDAPAELVDMARSQGLTRHTILRYLRHQGWVIPAIESVFNEIRIGLRDLKGD